MKMLIGIFTTILLIFFVGTIAFVCINGIFDSLTGAISGPGVLLFWVLAIFCLIICAGLLKGFFS